MAMGISPKYAQDIPLGDLTQQHFLVLAVEASERLGWKMGPVSKAGFKAYPKFSMSSYGEEVTLLIQGETAGINSECTGAQIVDWGKNKENVDNFVATIDELKNSISKQTIEQKYGQLKTEMISQEDDELLQKPETTKAKLEGLFAIFKPTEGYYITPILINLNLVVFIAMIISGVNFMTPDSESLLKWGANFRPLTLEGEWWRIVTSCFIHIGILHLIMNLYALMYIGLLLETRLGTMRFGVAYLLTGIAASMTSLWWHDLTVSAGASGAIFGMYGVFLAMLTTNFIEKSERKQLLMSIGIFVAYNLVYGLKGGIDNAAHLGGLLSGLIIGYAYIPVLKKPYAVGLNNATIVILSIVVLSASAAVYRSIPNDIPKYDEKIKLFAPMEERALAVYRLPDTASNEQRLLKIAAGIETWNEIIELVNDIERLKLPETVHERNEKLVEYCQLRIGSYNILYKTYSENTDKYQDSIDLYNNAITEVIERLKGK